MKIKTLLTLILLLIGMIGYAQGVYNIKTDPTKKDTFEFPTYYKYYAVNYMAITRIPNYAYAIVLGEGDSAEYLWRDRIGSVNDGVITNISILKIIVDKWTAYKQECWNDSTFKKNNDWCFETKRDAEFEMKLAILWGLKNHVIEQKNDTCYQIGWYEHTDTSLEGFMEYLKQRIGK